jgi:hypothetical protein
LFEFEVFRRFLLFVYRQPGFAARSPVVVEVRFDSVGRCSGSQTKKVAHLVKLERFNLSTLEPDWATSIRQGGKGRGLYGMGPGYLW